MVSCLVRRVTVVHTHISNPARRVRHRESAAIYSRDLRRDLVVLVTWPGNPEMEGGHWLLTRVMSAFERKYTNAEQNMHSTVPMLHGVLSELARRAENPRRKDDRLFASHLIDLVTAILGAPVSAETKALLEERAQ